MSSMNVSITIGAFIFDGGTGSNHGPVPSSMSVSLQDVDYESGRTADATMHRNRVAGGATSKRKIALQWAPCTTSDASKILQAPADEFFSVTYLDPYTGARRTSMFYAGDRTAPVLRGALGLWDSISYDLIER